MSGVLQCVAKNARDIAAQAEVICEWVRALVERDAEPFGDVGRAWPARFLADARPRRL